MTDKRSDRLLAAARHPSGGRPAGVVEPDPHLADEAG
jgi:hypothetical protein